VRSAAAAALQVEELRSAWPGRVQSAPAAQWVRVAELITGTAPVRVVTVTGAAQDGTAAAIMSTLAIGALGSDSAGAMEMILTVGVGLLPAMFGFAVTRITEDRAHSF
jgi:hypothetical protein